MNVPFSLTQGGNATSVSFAVLQVAWAAAMEVTISEGLHDAWKQHDNVLTDCSLEQKHSMSRGVQLPRLPLRERQLLRRSVGQRVSQWELQKNLPYREVQDVP